MTYSSRVEWETLRSIDSATLIGSFQAIGGPLIHPSFKLKLVNNSTSLVTISKDGTTAIDVAPANSFWLYDEGVLFPNNNPVALPAGAQIFVSGAAGTGLIYLVTQYIITI